MVSNPTDLRLVDWKECRSTVDRLDKILEDLRKFGFSLVTGLLTASALLGHAAADPRAVGAAFAAAMVLIAALFFVDTYYEVLLSGAVERALDVEVMTDPPIRVTRTISRNASASKAIVLILALYVALLTAALFLGLVNTVPAGPAATWPPIVAFVILLPAVLFYWRVAARGSKFHCYKHRVWPEDAGRPTRPPGRFDLIVGRLAGDCDASD